MFVHNRFHVINYVEFIEFQIEIETILSLMERVKKHAHHCRPSK